MRDFQRSWIVGLSLTFSALCVPFGIELAGQGKGQLAHAANGITNASPADAAISAGSANRRDVWFQEIVSRPLFSPDRKQVEDTGRSVSGLPRLTAIIVEGRRRIAIFAASPGSRATVVGVGSRIGVYDVRDIAADGITVAGPQGIMVIRPTFDTPSPAAVPLPATQKVALPGYFKVPRQ
jgi:hypothetical protein